MDKADIERWAADAGLTDPDLSADCPMTDYGPCAEALEKFAALVRAQAMEEAAQICDQQGASHWRPAAAIRAAAQQTEQTQRPASQ